MPALWASFLPTLILVVPLVFLGSLVVTFDTLSSSPSSLPAETPPTQIFFQGRAFYSKVPTNRTVAIAARPKLKPALPPKRPSRRGPLLKRAILCTLALLPLFVGCQKTSGGDGEPVGSSSATTVMSEKAPQPKGQPVMEVPFEPGQFVVDLPEGPEDKGHTQPIGLTASDGTGLQLTALRANVVLDDPLSFTELRLTFTNPNPRVIEGNFKMQLPAGAALSRFAMKVGSVWQEGEVVEKQAARAAYEDFLHRKQDPALMEQAPGNEFVARVFPIPANGQKELIISYSQTLAKGASYTLPLKGLSKIGSLNVQISAYGAKQPLANAERRNFTPKSDLVVTSTAFARNTSVRNDELVMFRVTPVSPTDATVGSAALRRAVFLLDTSASRMLGLKEQAMFLQELIGKMPADASIAVITFDQTSRVAFEGEAGKYGDKDTTAILERGALGASNLEQALAFANNFASGSKSYLSSRLVLLGDGVATAGEEDMAKLRERLKLKEATFERADAIVVGGLRDAVRLKQLVRSYRADGTTLDVSAGVGEVSRRLNLATRSQIKVDVPGASWFYPKTIDGVQPGDEVYVYARGVSGKDASIKIGEGAVQVHNARVVERALIARTVAQAEIEDLESQEVERGTKAKDGPSTKERITELSRANRVLSKHTAMLVLETDADYKRFNIDQRATLDILTVGQNGRIALDMHKRPGYEPTPTVTRTTTRPETFGNRGAAKGAAANEESRPRSAAGAAPAQEGRSGSNSDTTTAQASATSRGPGAPANAAPPPPFPADEAEKSKAEAKADSNGDLALGRGGQATPSPEPVQRRNLPLEQDRRSPRSLGGGQPRHVDLLDEERAPVASAAAATQRPASRIGNTEHTRLNEHDFSAAYTGRMATVMSQIKGGNKAAALNTAREWQKQTPSDVMALVALGEAYEANSDMENAARAYGSILELFSFRADSRRFAGSRLERIGTPVAYALAVDAFRGAVEQRPDHPSSHRMYAFALVRAGKLEEAFTALEDALKRNYPDGRFRGVQQILREDIGLVAQAWMRTADSKKQLEIADRLARVGGKLEADPSLRFVLTWETDANDVDFHIRDRFGKEAYYGEMELPSGGKLYADVTTGYGPECFTVRGTKRAYPYSLSAHYFARGPMGYGMGKLQVIEHDGKGNLTFEERPYVIMADNAFVQLGQVNGPLAKR
jgi:tetratricopeptide (TPR) repeat protein